MSEIKLAKCPFCDAELKRWDYMPQVFFEHPYNGCILSGKKVLESEHDIKAWNTRKPMERIIERIENARQKYQRLVKEQGEKEDEAMNIHFRGVMNIVKEEGGIDVLQSKEC